MKLYWSPGSCSLAVHIALREAGLSFEMAKVDIITKKLEDGSDYRALNPRGALPALALGDGEILTEAAVLLQYVAQHGAGGVLLPATGTLEYYRALEWLNYLASEVHKAFSVLFNPAAPEGYREAVKERLFAQFKEMDIVLSGSDWLANDLYSLADIYAFVITNWAGAVGMDLEAFGLIERVSCSHRRAPGRCGGFEG